MSLITDMSSMANWPKRKLMKAFNATGATDWWLGTHHIRTSSGLYVAIANETKGARAGDNETTSLRQMKRAIIKAVAEHAKQYPGVPVSLHFYDGYKVDGKAYNMAKSAMLEMQGIHERFGVNVSISDKLMDKPEPFAGFIRSGLTHRIAKFLEGAKTEIAIAKAGNIFGNLSA